MFIRKIVTAILLVVLLFGNIVAQPNTPKISPELRKTAVEFLRQTIKEIPNLKADENRQFFTIETARLLWKYDEQEARLMFERMMQEVKKSLAETSEKYKKAADEVKKVRKNANANYGYYNAVNRPANVVNSYASNRAYGNMANSSVYVEPEISIYEIGMSDEFRKIASLRKNLIDNLTDVEPILAYQFFNETTQLLPKNSDNYIFADYGQFEKRIVVKLLEDKEIDKAVEIAENILNKEFNNNFLMVLYEIYESDKLKGSALAEKTLQKVKTFSNDKGISYGEIASFFNNAVETKSQNPPMLTDKSLQELARFLGNNVLSAMDREFYLSPYEYAKKIEKYAPREALKILQKSKQKRYPKNSNSLSNAPYYAVNTANAVANAARAMANTTNRVAYAANMAANMPANTISNSPKSKNTKPKISPTPQETKLGEIPIEIEPIDTKAELMQKLSIGKFTVDEREKIIKQAKEYAFTQNYYGYARPERFISVVAELARFSIISADKEVADALMKEAATYIRPETKHAFDYAGKLMLAGGYSRHHPDKSFALMESMISINEVIEGSVKLGTFIDTESTFIINDEVSASVFLSDLRLGRDILRTEELQMFIQNLAQTDFQRTTGLADKFSRNEVKMTAKMLILDSLLGDKRESVR